MNIQKLVDSLDSNELKNLAKAVEKKLEKSEQMKAIGELQNAFNTHTHIDFCGKSMKVVGYRWTPGRPESTWEFDLDNGSKIVFDLEGR